MLSSCSVLNRRCRSTPAEVTADIRPKRARSVAGGAEYFRSSFVRCRGASVEARSQAMGAASSGAQAPPPCGAQGASLRSYRNGRLQMAERERRSDLPGAGERLVAGSIRAGWAVPVGMGARLLAVLAVSASGGSLNWRWSFARSVCALLSARCAGYIGICRASWEACSRSRCTKPASSPGWRSRAFRKLELHVMGSRLRSPGSQRWALAMPARGCTERFAEPARRSACAGLSRSRSFRSPAPRSAQLVLSAWA